MLSSVRRAFVLLAALPAVTSPLQGAAWADGAKPPTPATKGAPTAPAPDALPAPDLGAAYFESGPAEVARRRFRLEEWDAAATAFADYAKAHPKARDRLQAEFLAAYAANRAGRFTDAAARFDALVASYPLLADYHRLYAARALLAAKQFDGALARAKKIEAASPLDAEARYTRAEASRGAGDLVAAERELQGYLEAYPTSWREPEARERLAEAQEELARKKSDAKRLDGAKALYRQVMIRFPTESWAKLAHDRLAAIDPAALALTGPEQLTRGLALFDEMRNADSEAAFRAALAAGDLTALQQCVAAYNLAQSAFKARERPRAAPLFDAAEATCAAAMKAKPDDAEATKQATNLHAKSLYQGARCHAFKEEFAASLHGFERIEAEHPAHSFADDARLRQAEVLDSLIDKLNGRSVLLPAGRAPKTQGAPIQLALVDEKATLGEDLSGHAGVTLEAKVKRLHDRVTELLRTIPERYPTGDQGGEALFRLALDAWKRGAVDEAKKNLETELAKYPREDGWWEAGRTLYWLGRIAATQQKTADAGALFARAARDYPLSYYALAAINRLRETSPAEAEKLIAALRTPAPTEEDLGWRFQPSAVFAGGAFQRGAELARLGLGAEARRELLAAGIKVPERRSGVRPDSAAGEELLWAAAVLYDRAGEWAISHTIPRYVLTEYARTWPTGTNARRWRISFPRGYAELIVPNAEKNGQPVALQFAIVREESAFNPSDESFANAIGLTQLTLEPAKRFAQGLPYSREALRNPVVNVTIGARELGDVWKKASGLAPLAIAAYNAGEGAVRRWVRRAPADTGVDEFIESIPFDETRGYTKRVLGSYFAYQFLYGTGDPVPSLPQALPAKY